jgi:hypothetical protein
MRYSDKTKLFWKILYKETSGKAIRFASGKKNKGCVVQQEAKRGKYNPKDAMANFAVPDVRVIAEADPMKTGLKSEIQPGLIPESLDLLQNTMVDNKTDIILMGDGKGLARGQLPGGKGDVDLFGHEEAPTKQHLQRFIDNIQKTVDGVRNDVCQETLKALLYDSSHLVKKLQLRSQYFSKRRQGIFKRYEKEKNEKAYSAGMSWVNAMDYKIRCAVEKFTDMNGEINSLLAHLQGNHDSFAAGDVPDVTEISNLRLLKEPNHLQDVYDLENATELVKPGTELWFKLRHEAYVTGDTVFDAIGLKSVDAMKKHYNYYVKNMDSENFSPEENVKPATFESLGIVASKVASSLYKNATVQQVGVFFQDSKNCRRFLAATPDCVLRHSGGNTVPVIFEMHDVVSFTYPSKESLCRAMCEMCVLGSNEALHISVHPGCIVTHVIEMDSHLAEKVIQIAVDLYEKSDDTKSFTLPLKSQMTWKGEILSELDKCYNSCCRDGVTLPYTTFSDSLTTADDDTVPGPYIRHAPRKMNDLNSLFLDAVLKYVLDICDNNIVDTHTLLRPQADEIFAIMATDTNRVSRPGVPAQIPVAYGLKGGGLSADLLRSMMDEVKDELHSRNINVVCEVFDGHHRSYMERDAAGSPLYRTRLQLDTWNKVSNLGKAALIQEVEKLASVEQDLPYLQEHRRMHCEWKIEGNIFILHTKKCPCPPRKRKQGVFFLSTRGGPLQTIGILQNLHSTRGWFVAEEQDCIDFSTENVTDAILTPGSEHHHSSACPKGCNRLTNALLHEQPSFLQRLVSHLQKARPKKWEQLNPSKLLTKYLVSADILQKDFIVKEFEALNELVKKLTGKKLFPKCCKTKERKASVVSSFFGGCGNVTGMLLNPLSLREYCKTALMSHNYPVLQLRVALAQVYHIKEKESWYDASPLPLRIVVDEDGNEVDLFSYPEYNHLRGKVEPKVTDPYHILTNLRKGATSGAYPELCDKEAWQRVVSKDRKLLTTSIVEDNVDKQDGSLARRVFSEPVQKIMEENGDIKTAQFVFHVRNWFEACDKRGLSAAERITHLVQMQKFLCSGISFDTFPPPTQYVRTMPIVTFEAILANIATRIQLYSICRAGTYNHRAVSSLAVENFFSTLANTSPTGCPRASDIPSAMGQIVALNHYKHLDSNELGFHYQTASKLTYDVHILDKHLPAMDEDSGENTSLWKNHAFDACCVKSKKYEKGSFAHDLKPLKGDLAPLKGVRPVRSSFYKIDEQKLDTLRRMGVDSAELLKFGIPLEWNMSDGDL